MPASWFGTTVDLNPLVSLFHSNVESLIVIPPSIYYNQVLHFEPLDLSNSKIVVKILNFRAGRT